MHLFTSAFRTIIFTQNLTHTQVLEESPGGNNSWAYLGRQLLSVEWKWKWEWETCFSAANGETGCNCCGSRWWLTVNCLPGIIKFAKEATFNAKLKAQLKLMAFSLSPIAKVKLAAALHLQAGSSFVLSGSIFFILLLLVSFAWENFRSQLFFSSYHSVSFYYSLSFCLSLSLNIKLYACNLLKANKFLM